MSRTLPTFGFHPLVCKTGGRDWVISKAPATLKSQKPATYSQSRQRDPAVLTSFPGQSGSGVHPLLSATSFVHCDMMLQGREKKQEARVLLSVPGTSLFLNSSVLNDVLQSSINFKLCLVEIYDNNLKLFDLYFDTA